MSIKKNISINQVLVNTKMINKSIELKVFNQDDLEYIYNQVVELFKYLNNNKKLNKVVIKDYNDNLKNYIYIKDKRIELSIPSSSFNRMENRLNNLLKESCDNLDIKDNSYILE